MPKVTICRSFDVQLRGTSERNDSGVPVRSKAPETSVKSSGRSGASTGQAARDGLENSGVQRGGKKRGDSDVRRSITAFEDGSRASNVRASTEAFAARPKVPRTPELHSR